MSSNALLLLNSYSLGDGIQQTYVDALIHLLRDHIPAIAAVTVITAAHVKQIVAVLKAHASVLAGTLVYGADFLEGALAHLAIQLSFGELIVFLGKLALGGGMVFGTVAFGYWLYRLYQERQDRLAAEARARDVDPRNHLIKHYPS